MHPGMTIASATPTVDQNAVSPLGEILRDISRGGLAGLITGFVGAGIGGRLAMRLAALLVPESAGMLTQNGNRVGDITLSGSLGLFLAGAVVGLFAGTVWVVVSPWIPGTGLRRALVATPIAAALGTIGLIEGDNPDFVILRHDPRVVAVLLALVGAIGFLFPLVDGWLDRRLPHVTHGSGLAATYGFVAGAGAILIFPIVVLGYFQSPRPATVLLGVALFGVGLATLGRWGRRLRGKPRPPRTLTIAGRASLLAAVLVGCVATAVVVGEALAIR